MINAVKEINTTKDDMKVSGDTLGREGVSSIFTPNFLVAKDLSFVYLCLCWQFM